MSTEAANRAFCRMPRRISAAILRGEEVSGKRPGSHAARLGEFPLLVPATQPVNFIATDLYIEITHGNVIWQCGHFILCRKHHIGGPNRLGKSEFLQFGETLAKLEFSLAVDARIGNGLVEGDFRRPLGNGVVTFAALVEPDVHGMDFVEKFRGAFDEKIC